MNNQWEQAMFGLGKGPHTPTHEVWFVKTVLGRFIPIAARIRREHYDRPPDGFYEKLDAVNRVAEVTQSELICEFVDADSEDKAWKKTVKNNPGVWEVVK